MANKHYEHALDGLPCRVSATATIIYQIICYRFDDRVTLPNGKPNPGHGKSYPGMDAFVKATGRTRQACNTAIEELIANKLVNRITIGKPGSRAEYVPIYTLNDLGISVKNTLHVSKQYKSKKLADNVKRTSIMSKEGLPNETSLLNTISTISNHKYDKSKTNDYVNYQRWHVISQALPRLLVSQWRHTKESEECLDSITQITTLTAFVADLRRHKFEQAGDQTGLFMSHLRKCAGVNKPIKGLSMGEQVEKELDEFSNYDLEAELKKFNPGVDLDSAFKLPE
jgi:hypothetical protein